LSINKSSEKENKMATPSSPISNLSNFSPKSFWSKPEGKPGMILMAALAAAGAYGLYLALPFLIALTENLILLGVLIGVLVGGVALVMNGTVQALAKNIFQSICRGIATMYTTIDPIGILRNQLDDMKKAKTELDMTIQRFAGSDNKLTSKIAQKTQLVQQLMGKADELGRRIAAGQFKTQDDLETAKLQKETWESQAGLEYQGLQQLQELEKQTADMLDKFRHWSRVSDAKIDRMKIKVDFYAAQRETILEAQKTLGIGLRLLKGDPEQLKLTDMAIEYLTDDAARTIGEIQEFNKTSEKMLLDIDIENSANARMARQQLMQDFGTKLEADANKPSAVQQLEQALAASGQVPSIPRVPVVGKGVAVGGTTTGNQGTGDYNDLFRKN
jgi:hypothetical protein